MDKDGTWHRGGPWSRPHCARWGPSSPPQFKAHFCCGQTAGCIKMPLGMNVGFSPGDFVLDGDSALPPQKGGGAPKFSAYVYCGQMARCIKMPFGMEVGLTPGDFVLDGDPSSLPKKAHVYCGQTAAWIKMPLCSEVGLCQDGTWLGLRSRPHCARWQPQLRSPKRGQSPQFSVHFCCGQTAGWIKVPLGTEVGLGPDDIALDGDPAPPPPKKGHSPQFSASVRCGQMAGWTKMPHGVEVGLGPGDFVFDGDSAPARKKGTALHPVFGPCLLWPNGYGSRCHLVRR